MEINCEIRKRVLKANVDLWEKGIVIYTWGNVSEIDRRTNYVYIKPSGVDYSIMTEEDIVVVDLLTGDIVCGDKKPSTDTPTHLEIYKAFPEVGGITHTHSIYAVAFAQAGLDIPIMGTTHADYFAGDIPCTRPMTDEEICRDYEENTGRVIVDTFNDRSINPKDIPAVLVRNHGPFIFGTNSTESEYNAVVLETIAKMAHITLELNESPSMLGTLVNKHFSRKHGKNAYYGQR